MEASPVKNVPQLKYRHETDISAQMYVAHSQDWYLELGILEWALDVVFQTVMMTRSSRMTHEVAK